MNTEVNKMPLKNSIFCFLAALIWGVGFVAQSKGMNYLGPFSFNGGRSLLGAAALLPFVLVRRKKQKQVKESRSGDALKDKESKISGRNIKIAGGVCCGLALCAASTLQQIGIQYTSVGKAGFITTLYIIMVPLFGIVLRKKVPLKVWGAAIIALIGLYLLCINESFSLAGGDVYIIISACVFAVHILLIDYFSPKMDGVELSFLQFLVIAIVCGTIAFIIEGPTPADFLAGILPLAYTGIISCGVAYTFQILGQKNADPSIASLILSLESVISVLAGWIILRQTLNIRELTGCAVVLGAVMLVQIPGRRAARSPEAVHEAP